MSTKTFREEKNLEDLATPPLSGFELDRAVDERVFGVSYDLEDPHYLTPYSLTVGRAWRVVEHLAAQGWRLSLVQTSLDPSRWCAAFRHGRRELRVEVWADTAPEAICRAALNTEQSS